MGILGVDGRKTPREEGGEGGKEGERKGGRKERKKEGREGEGAPCPERLAVSRFQKEPR